MFADVGRCRFVGVDHSCSRSGIRPFKAYGEYQRSLNPMSLRRVTDVKELKCIIGNSLPINPLLHPNYVMQQCASI